MLEDNVVDDRDVEGWEDGDETSDDGPEKELIAPDIVHPLREVQLTAWDHSEERASGVYHLPREEESEPGKADESSRASSEDEVALLAIVGVTSGTEVSITEAEHNLEIWLVWIDFHGFFTLTHHTETG